MSDELRKLINEIIGETVRKEIATMLKGGAPDYPTGDDNLSDSDTSSVRNPSVRRSRVARKGPRVAYTLIRRPGRQKEPTLFPTAQLVYEFVKAHQPTTAADIKKGTKLPKKTVESCLYHLRHAKLVESSVL